MFFNSDITIFNRYWSSIKKCEEWLPTHIYGVSWIGSQIASIGEKGFNQANTYTIRIPVDAHTGGKHYANCKDWIRNQSLSWTLQSGDLIVKGIIADRPAKASELHQKYPETMTILGFSDNRSGPKCVQHWKVSGK